VRFILCHEWIADDGPVASPVNDPAMAGLKREEGAGRHRRPSI